VTAAQGRARRRDADRLRRAPVEPSRVSSANPLSSLAIALPVLPDPVHPTAAEVTTDGLAIEATGSRRTVTFGGKGGA
jgi:hypothetical protein